MSQYCEDNKLIQSNINNKINAKNIVIECIQAFKNINESIFINVNKNNKNNIINPENNIVKKELKNIGIRLLLYYATPENRIATANIYNDYFIEDDLPKTYVKFITEHKMFEPLRNATDFRFLEIHGDGNDTCLSMIKVRVYFNSIENGQSHKSSIDYKFIIQRIYMPQRDLNYDWRVASITII